MAGNSGKPPRKKLFTNLSRKEKWLVGCGIALATVIVLILVVTAVYKSLFVKPELTPKERENVLYTFR